MKKLKEFWLQPSTKISTETLQRLIDRANPDAILVDDTPKITATKIASHGNHADIRVVSDIQQLPKTRPKANLFAFETTVRDKHDHERVVQALKHHPDYVLVHCPDWRVIPLENLIAESKGRSKLLANTQSFEESKLALNCLEAGVDGIVLSSNNLDEILKTRDLLSIASRSIELERAKITSVRMIGNGSRVCVDTVEIIAPGEGLLTGCSSGGMFLVEAEVGSNPHVNPRPFRVNAGPVSLYTMTGESKTSYLSELSAGHTVLLVNSNGETRTVDVARAKIERRPMILIEASVGDRAAKTIAQNAETVRLVTPLGSTPVSQLKPGDEVLVRLEKGGRHFGTHVANEMIIER